MPSPRQPSQMPSPRPQSPQIEMTDERTGLFWSMLTFFHLLFRAKARANNSENKSDEIEENGWYLK